MLAFLAQWKVVIFHNIEQACTNLCMQQCSLSWQRLRLCWVDFASATSKMNKVIFLGSEKSGKKHIIKHVLQNSELKFTSAQSIPTAQEQLNINNKYYSASVQLDYFSVHQAPPSTINWKEYQAVVAMYCTNKVWNCSVNFL